MKNNQFWEYNLALSFMASGLINYLLVYQYNIIWMWFVSCIPLSIGFFLFCKLTNIEPKYVFRWFVGFVISLLLLLFDLISMIHVLERTRYMYISFFISLILTFFLLWFYLNFICIIIKSIWKVSQTNKKHAHSIAFGIEFAAAAVAIFDFIWRIAKTF